MKHRDIIAADLSRRTAELAAADPSMSSVDATTISGYRSGRRTEVQWSKVAALARVLEVPPAWLLDGAGHAPWEEQDEVPIHEGRPDLERIIKQQSAALAVLPPERASVVLELYRGEFFRGAGGNLPPSYWPERLSRLIAEEEGRAKDVHLREAAVAVDLTEESPEVRAARRRPKRL
jgi:hypothetical protein